MTIDANPTLAKDNSAPAHQLIYRTRFGLTRTLVGAAIVGWGGYLLIRFLNNHAWNFHGAASYLGLFLMMSMFGIATVFGMMIALSQTCILFDRKATTAIINSGILFFRRPKTIDLGQFVECLVTAEKDNNALSYTVRIVFKNGPDLEVWVTGHQSIACSIADEINSFWGFTGPRRAPILRDKQLESKQWLDKQP